MLRDREHQIGHTYFLDIRNVEQLAEAFRNRIFPLLQEYFFDDWAKIRAVLGNNAFVVEKSPRFCVPNPDVVDEDRKAFDRLPGRDERWRSIDEYQAIYRPRQSASDE